MGASTVVRTCDRCDESTLKKWVANMQAQDAHENGSSYSGYWNMCRGLEIRSEKVFPSEIAAEDYLGTVMQKWENLIAVPALQLPNLSPETMHNDASLKAWDAARHELFNTRQKYPGAVLERAKSAKASLKACAHCGSKISVQHLRNTQCPVCAQNLLLTATDQKHMDSLAAKIKALADKCEARKVLLQTKLCKETPPKEIWVIGGVCAS